ncbi:MAG TPA: protein-L-isoaspartate O-methyltransferase [Caulobacter sp.]|nr:protein-L-isoaspartate O-methyltransferase [Caulobacter sp.]
MATDFAAARENMIQSQVRTADVTNLEVQDAMRAVARESLVAPGKGHAAYADTEVEYAPGRWMMRPRDVAKLLQALEPKAGETALAIAAPYAAAVLEAMGLEVTRVDGEDLTAVEGRYDLVISEGAVSTVPPEWTAALKLHGRLGVVERSGPVGRACVHVRSEEGVGGRPVFDSAAPFLSGFGPKPAFAF